MNWSLVWWFFGVCATLTALKFVIVLFRSIFNKETMQNAIETAGNKISETSEKMTEKIKEKAAERRVRKEEEKKNGSQVIKGYIQ